MKNALPYLLLLLPFWAAAQPKIVRQTQAALTPDGWQKNYKIEYRYNPQWLLTEQANFFLNEHKKWEPASRLTNEYDAAGNLTQPLTAHALHTGAFEKK